MMDPVNPYKSPSLKALFETREYGKIRGHLKFLQNPGVQLDNHLLGASASSCWVGSIFKNCRYS
jgi:hypothetical protein